jgi:membrane associated rhomboid family serine protease
VTSPDATAKFGTPVFYAAIGRAFVVMCWVVPSLAVIEFFDQRLDNELDYRLGIRPKEVSGLPGILFAPLVHNGWDHYLANSGPLIILGTFALAGGTRRFVNATWLIAVTSGLAVWIMTPEGYLVLGASGVVFGWLGLLFVRGLVDRTSWSFMVALVAGLLFGWQLYLLQPTDDSISWQGHLFGFIGGAVAAIVTRRPKPKPAPKPG